MGAAREFLQICWEFVRPMFNGPRSSKRGKSLAYDQRLYAQVCCPQARQGVYCLSNDQEFSQEDTIWPKLRGKVFPEQEAKLRTVGFPDENKLLTDIKP